MTAQSGGLAIVEGLSAKQRLLAREHSKPGPATPKADFIGIALGMTQPCDALENTGDGSLRYADLMRPIRFALFTLVATLLFSQEVSDPWPANSLMEPAALAKELQSGKSPKVLCVAFPVLYNSKHIVHAAFAGPGSKPEGLEALKKAAATLPRDADLVIYCGCCPMVKCPNIRPAYRVLKEMGFTRIRVLDIPTNMHTDWFSKDYPSEPGSAAGSTSSN